MKKTTFVLAQQDENKSLLFVDKKNVFAKELIKKISSDYPDWNIVFVGENNRGIEGKNIDFLQFRRRVPKIPDIQYTHIVVFFHEEEEIKELLPEFVRKADLDNAKLFVIAHRLTPSAGQLASYLGGYKQSCLIWLGEIFGKDVETNPSFAIHRYIEESVRLGRVTILGMGMRRAHPIFLDDAIDAIKEVLFQRAPEKKYFIFSKNSPTELSLAWIFHKINPLIQIDFFKDLFDQEEKDMDEEGVYMIGDKYPLQKKIQDLGLLNQGDLPHRQAGVLKNIKTGPIFPKPFKEKKKKDFSFFWVLKTAIFVLLLPTLMVGIFLFFGIFATVGARYSLEKGDIGQAKTALFLSRYFFNFALQGSAVLSLEYGYIGQKKTAVIIEDNIRAGQVFLEGGAQLLNGFSDLKQVGEKGSNASLSFASGIGNLKQALVSYQKIQAEISTKENPPLLFTKIMPVQSAFAFINSLDRITSLFQNTSDFLPEIFGMNEKKKYLVLFQNNMELRPTGGFIGSYAIVDFDKGKLENFSIADVYDADGQLKAHIEPPFAIRRYLPSVHWYMRDSNFDLDFPKSASAAAVFLKAETGDRVDGVISVDTTFVKNLLVATGPVYVSDYRETVDTNNFYQLTQDHAEKNFFPGSSQKKDFLRSLFFALQQKILVQKQVSYMKLLEVVNSAIAQKHVMIAMNSSQIQKVINISGAGSTLEETRPFIDLGVLDFLSVNEANIGVNKANYLLKRRMVHQVNIQDDGSMRGTLALMYKNNNTNGDYKAYVRIALPEGSTISSLYIDKNEKRIIPAVIDPLIYEAKKFVPPEDLEVERYEELGKTVYGLLMIVPKEEIKIITISYNYPFVFPVNALNPAYSYKIFKQPGTLDDQYSFSLIYPPHLEISSMPSFLQKRNGEASGETRLLEDKTFQIKFVKK